MRWLLQTALLATLVTACRGDESGSTESAGAEVALTRAGRFGSLRDFVLIERIDGGGAQALFVDRFEATQGDWSDFAASLAGGAVRAREVRLVGDRDLPVAHIDLVQARAFCRWRFGRLPTSAEWELVAGGEGRSRFPWGSNLDPSRANTGELGMGESTPVGTFESGRKAGGDAPYDLVGNLAEWTESVPFAWTADRLAFPDTLGGCRRRTLALPAIGIWQQPGGILPLGLVLAGDRGAVPRIVVGGDFATPMSELAREQGSGERRSETGLRVYATAAELLDALLGDATPPDEAEREQLRRFVSRGRHAAVLRAALSAVRGFRAEEPAAPLASTGQVLLDAMRDSADRGGR